MRNSLQPLLGKIINNLDVITSIVGCFVGTLILFLSFSGYINQYSIGFTIFFTSVLYLILKSRFNEEITQRFYFSFRQKKALDILFFILIGITSIIWYNQLYSRPIEYFILLSFLSGLISLDIISYKKENNLVPILLKIFFLAMMIRAGIYYNFPSIMGYDAYTHTNIANVISITGFVPPFEISGKYINYPILHILISMTKTLSFIDVKDAVFLSIGLISIISLFFVFIFVNRIAGTKIGLLSILIIGISNDIIVAGITNITAGSLVLCYFMMILFLFLYKKSSSRIFISILFFITAVMILTHQLSTFVVFLSIVLISMSFLLFEFSFNLKEKNPIFLLYIPFFAISMFTYWMSTPAHNQLSFFEAVLAPFLNVLEVGGQYGSDVLIVGHGYARPLIETLLLQVSYLILPFFAIGGIYLWLSKKDAIKFSISLTTATLFFLVYVIPFLGIRNLLTSRWMPFLLVFLGILAAAYIVSCVDLIKSNFNKFVIIFIIIGIFSFLMIATPSINKDNPLVAKDTTIRNQFTFNEINAIVTLQSIYKHNIYTDSSFVRAFLFYGSNPTIEDQRKMLSVVSSYTGEKDLSIVSNEQGSLIILRKSTLNEPISFKASELKGDNIAAPLSRLAFDYLENSDDQNLVFNNGNVLGYYIV